MEELKTYVVTVASSVEMFIEAKNEDEATDIAYEATDIAYEDAWSLLIESLEIESITEVKS